MPLVFFARVTKSCEFCVNCAREILGILNMPQVLNIPNFECIRNLDILDFHMVY